MADRIGTGIAHYDRDRAGRLLGGADRRYAHGQNEVHLESDQSISVRGDDTRKILTELKRKILSFDIAELAESLAEVGIDAVGKEF